MALLRFDLKTLNIDVLVGVLESYKPNKDVKKLIKNVEKFKTDYSSALVKNFGTYETQELMQIFDKETEKRDTFKKLLQEEITPKIKEITTEIERINKQLCANYTA